MSEDMASSTASIHAEKKVIEKEETEYVQDVEAGEKGDLQQTPDSKKKRRRRRRGSRGKGSKNQSADEPSSPDGTTSSPSKLLNETNSTPNIAPETPDKCNKESGGSVEIEGVGEVEGEWEVVQNQDSPATTGGKKKRNRRRNRPKSASSAADKGDGEDNPTVHAQIGSDRSSSSAKCLQNKETIKSAPPSVKRKEKTQNIDKSMPENAPKQLSTHSQNKKCTYSKSASQQHNIELNQSRSNSAKDSPKKMTTNNTPPSVRRKDQRQEKTPRTPKNQDQRGGAPRTPQQGSHRGNKNRSNARTPRTPQSARNVGGTPGRQRFKFQPFEDYWSLEDVSHGLKREQLHKGAIRINPRNFEEAYLDNPVIGGADIIIEGITARNRAMPGDIVAYQLLPKSEWRVALTDFKVHLSDQQAKSSKKERTSSNDVAKDLQNLSINESSSSSQKEDSKHNSNQSNDPPPIDDLKQGLLETHEKELEDMQKVVKKLFAEDILEGADGASNDAKDGDAGGKGGRRDAKGKPVIPDKCYQMTAKVVYIIEKKHSRACTGHLKKQSSQKALDALFSPVDSRLPRIYIPLTACPDGFQERPQDFESTLFIARIDEWPQNSSFAKGHLQRSLGEAGEIEPETEGILIENEIDYSEFSEEVLNCLPTNLPWRIPGDELARRKDLRKECIFTIDPATARDLDDALHCKPLGNRVYEVGVHIADVSFFVAENTALDRKASDRATSVYLVQKVIPMLPRLLCEQLCSLNPDEDRLTFSVIWKITEDGEILEEWFGRSVIRSCVKMAYNHAQDIIEDPKKTFAAEELPPITNGFSIPEIVQGVINLNKIAVNLRKKRFEAGALRLDQVKLQFALDRESGMPSGYSVYQQRDSNRLVEEFMLLANMAVAHKIYGTYKETALLRRHPPPKSKMMDDLLDQCSEMGLAIKADSSGELQASLSKYMGEDQVSKGMQLILTLMYAKPMQRALYFCTGSINNEEAYRHYALSVPLYTHFTSPIRRYADVIVHRLLAATLGCGPKPERDIESTQAQAAHCNKKKDNAKDAGDRSSELFFSVFVKECGPIEEDGMVMQVMDHSFDVLILKLGVTQRVYCNKLPLRLFDFQSVRRHNVLTLVWKADNDHPESTQEIKIFSVVRCVLESGDKPRTWGAIIKRPEEGCIEPAKQ